MLQAATFKKKNYLAQAIWSAPILQKAHSAHMCPKSAEMWFRREFQVASKTDKKPFSSRLSVLCESGQVWLSWQTDFINFAKNYKISENR